MFRRLKLSDRNKLTHLKPLLISILSIIILSSICSKWFFQLLLIQGDSMLPSYHNLQIVIIDKRKNNYSPGDVIAFKCGALSSVLVKRVVAVPGDEAIIQEGTLYVNGKKSQVFSEDRSISYAGNLSVIMKLEDEQYLVLGDNLSESKDSRYPEVGIVVEKEILGRIIVN